MPCRKVTQTEDEYGTAQEEEYPDYIYGASMKEESGIKAFGVGEESPETTKKRRVVTRSQKKRRVLKRRCNEKFFQNGEKLPENRIYCPASKRQRK
jgi:hypothetical protein